MQKKEWRLWVVFLRSRNGLNHKHCGSVHNFFDRHRQDKYVAIELVPEADVAVTPPAR